MSRETAEQVIELLRRHPRSRRSTSPGGAPELNPQFRFLVTGGRGPRSPRDRPLQPVGPAPALAARPRRLPRRSTGSRSPPRCPPSAPSGTDAQRGDGVFAKSLEALRLLNDAGYGKGEGLVLNLVHNPVGAFLPGDQASLERDYRRELQLRHGIVFDRLYTITNMPISRFLEHLERTGNLQRYMELLVASFNPRAADGVMCRTYLSVGWDGTLYDCDFNQMLELPTNHGAPQTLATLLAPGGALPRRVVTDRHCFGCTAGAGLVLRGSGRGVARPRHVRPLQPDRVGRGGRGGLRPRRGARARAALQHRADAAGRRRRRAAEDGQARPRAAHLGPRPAHLARGRAGLHQRARRDRVGEAVVPRGLRPPALPDPGHRLLRVAEARREAAPAVAHPARLGARLRLRGPVGAGRGRAAPSRPARS